MKKLLVCILAVMPLLFVSCKKDDKSNVQEPKNDVGTEWIVYENDGTSYAPGMKFQDGYLVCAEDNRYTWDLYVASVGKVNSLKEVNYVPTSGWAKSIKIQIGHGYVLKCQTSTSYGANQYTRIRFLEYIDKGSATGYRMRYQDKWDPLRDE